MDNKSDFVIHIEHLCGSELWNDTLILDAETPNLTTCLRRTLLLWVPVSIIWILGLIHVLKRRHSNEKQSISKLSKLKIILAVFVLLMLIAELAVIVHSQLPEDALQISEILYFVILLATFISDLILLIIDARHGVDNTAFHFFYWLLLLTLSVPTFKVATDNVHNTEEFKSASMITIIQFVTYFCAFIVNLISDNEGKIEISEETSSFASKITFSWLDNVFYKGFQKTPLKYEHFPGIANRLDLDDIVLRLDKVWSKKHKILSELERYDETSKFKEPKNETGSINIFPILFKSFGIWALLGGIMKGLNDCLIFIGPQILRKYIRVFTDNDESWKAYFWAAMILILGLVQSTVSNNYFKIMTSVGTKMKTATISAIYRKTLSLSSCTSGKYSSGQINNLMSIDAQIFIQALPHFNLLWSVPLQIALSAYFLYNLVGVSAFAGIAILLFTLPFEILMNKFNKTFQSRIMKASDKRLLLLNEILKGIKVLKLYAWEIPFMKKLNEIREEEIVNLKKEGYVRGVNNLIFCTTPPLITLTCFGTYVMLDPENNILTAEKVFACMAIFNIIRIPLLLMPTMCMQVVRMYISVRRINRFLNAEDITEYIEQVKDEKIAAKFESAHLSWHTGTDLENLPCTLEDIDISIQKGNLIAVMGRVGAGKSSLLSGILSEMTLVKGSVQVSGSISYVPQQAWIQNMSVKDNILFGQEFDRKKYDEVLYNCALNEDLEIFPDGDETEIGENGVNLSGGQKQRISLARAAYSDNDIVLLDDPLSAVDVHVAEHLFNNLIGPNGMLKNKTRILVTHNTTFLNDIDNIILMENGKIIEQGTYEELSKSKTGQFHSYVSVLEKENDESEEIKDEVNKKKKTPTTDNSTKADKNKLVKTEEAQEGRVKITNLLYFMRKATLSLMLIYLLLTLGSEGLNTVIHFVLKDWTDDVNVNGILTVSEHMSYFQMIGIFVAVKALVDFYLGFSYKRRSAVASRRIHESVLESVLHCPIGFFESTPMGRIVNRFSSDLSTVDQIIPQTLHEAVSCLFMTLAVFFVISYTTPVILVFLIIASASFVLIGVYYQRTKRQLKRIDSINKSPVFVHFSETIQGISTIRAYKQQKRFLQANEVYVNKSLKSSYINDVSTRWLAYRVDYLANFIIFGAAVLPVYYRDSITPGLAALSVTFAMMMIDPFGWCVRMFCELETNCVALERLKEYEDLDQEPEWFTENGKNWIQNGDIKFDNYSTRYNIDFQDVLKDLSLDIKNGEKIGICGRTGAGKSSMALAVFRMLEPTKGSITIDGRDIREIGLQDLRSSITIIPQDPVLFSGTLRFNLDPTDSFSDPDIWDALEHSHMSEKVSQMENGLYHNVSEGGKNLSVGQRQLVCLARALLRKSKILVLDEATAAMDSKTDESIQETLKIEFKNCTVLTIAHRLNTIVNSDKILVLAKGMLVEFDSPDKLLSDSNSEFYKMCKNANIINERQ